MKKIKVPAVYINSDKIKTHEEKERLEMLLEKMDSERKIILPKEHMNYVLAKSGWYDKAKRTGQKRQGNPNIILTTFNWEDERNKPKAEYQEFIPGRFAFADFRDKQQLRKEKGVICNSGYEIHTSFGCLHSCSYCHVGNALTIMLDIEKFIEHLSSLMENNPWQKLYKFDNQGDILTLEPEYGAAKKLVELFSKTDKTLMLYTKSDNVDFLLGLEHRGRTKVCWTMSCEEVARKYEHGTASLKERIDAARKCQEAGYGIRFRFSPIIPIRNWEEKNKDMVEKVFSAIKPEVVCLETLCHMNKDQFSEIFTDMECKPKKNISEYELFSHKKRSEIYRFFIKEIKKHDQEAAIAVCLETEKMWKDLGKLLKGTPDNFYCCCGAKCA